MARAASDVGLLELILVVELSYEEGGFVSVHYRHRAVRDDEGIGPLVVFQLKPNFIVCLLSVATEVC
jgi:hypothetical protein